jgi:hypothetical protein
MTIDPSLGNTHSSSSSSSSSSSTNQSSAQQQVVTVAQQTLAGTKRPANTPLPRLPPLKATKVTASGGTTSGIAQQAMISQSSSSSSSITIIPGLRVQTIIASQLTDENATAVRLGTYELGTRGEPLIDGTNIKSRMDIHLIPTQTHTMLGTNQLISPDKIPEGHLRLRLSFKDGETARRGYAYYDLTISKENFLNATKVFNKKNPRIFENLSRQTTFIVEFQNEKGEIRRFFVNWQAYSKFENLLKLNSTGFLKDAILIASKHAGIQRNKYNKKRPDAICAKITDQSGQKIITSITHDTTGEAGFSVYPTEKRQPAEGTSEGSSSSSSSSSTDMSIINDHDVGDFLTRRKYLKISTSRGTQQQLYLSISNDSNFVVCEKNLTDLLGDFANLCTIIYSTDLSENEDEIKQQVKYLFLSAKNEDLKKIFKDNFINKSSKFFLAYYRCNHQNAFSHLLNTVRGDGLQNNNQEKLYNKLVRISPHSPQVANPFSTVDSAKTSLFKIRSCLINDTFFLQRFLEEANKYLNIGLTLRELKGFLRKPLEQFNPTPEQISKSSKLERWLKAHQRGKTFLWQPSKIPSKKEIINQLFPGVDNINDAKELPLEMSKLQNAIASGYRVADYTTTLLLFHLRTMFPRDETIIKESTSLIQQLVKFMDTYQKGEFIRYVELIDTPEGSLLRHEMYNGFFTWAPWSHKRAEQLVKEGDNPNCWLSVQEILRRITSTTIEFLETGPNGMGRSRFQMNQHTLNLINNEELFDLSCKKIIKRCSMHLDALEQGKEVHLPSFYHGMRFAYRDVVAEDIIGEHGKIIERNDAEVCRNSGASISTAPCPEFFSPGISWPVHTLYPLPTHKIVTMIPSFVQGVKTAESWIGIEGPIPVSLISKEGQTETHVAINGIVSKKLTDQKNIIDRLGLEDEVFLSGPIEAYIFHYIKELCTPNHVPRHWPRLAQKPTGVLSKEEFSQLSHQELMHRFVYNPHIHTGENSLPLYSQWSKGNNEKLHAILQNSANPRIQVGKGFVVDQAEAGGSDSFLQLSEVQAERLSFFNTINELFNDPQLPPPLRHVWDHDEGSLFGQAVNYNPYLVVNSCLVQHMLIDFLDLVMEKIKKADENIYLNRTLEDNQNIIFTNLAYKIISSALPTKRKDILLVRYISYCTEKRTVPIDYNTFDIQTRGIDLRKNPNEPALIFHLLSQLNENEKKSLLKLISGKEEASSERVGVIAKLLEDLGQAIKERYFFENPYENEYLPKQISNDALMLAFNDGCPTEEIIKKTQLHFASQEGVTYGARTFNSVETTILSEYLARSPKMEKDIWKSLEDINHLTKRSPEASYEILLRFTNGSNEEPIDSLVEAMVSQPMEPTVENIVNLAKVRELMTETPKDQEIIEHKLEEIAQLLPPSERGKFIRLYSMLHDDMPLKQCLEPLYEHSPSILNVTGVLYEALEYANNASLIAEEEIQNYMEWKRHIEIRLEKLESGENVMLAKYMFQPKAVSQEGCFRLFLHHDNMDTGSIFYSEMMDMFAKNFASSSGDQQYVDLAKTSELQTLPTLCRHLPKYRHPRASAAFIVGTHSDPEATPPVMTPEVAKLELEFIKQYRNNLKNNLMNVVK